MQTFCILLLTAVAHFVAGDRDLWVLPNPDCTQDCHEKNLRVLQVNSLEKDDQIVYMLSSFGSPTVFLARFNSSQVVHSAIDWTCLQNQDYGCVTFDRKPKFTTSYIINRVIEYDDVDDTRNARAVDEGSVRSTILSGVGWQEVKADGYSNPEWTLFLNSTNSVDHALFRENVSDSFLQIDFDIYDRRDRIQKLPSILHTEKTGLFEITLSNLQLHFNHSRFAVEIIVIDDSLPGSSRSSSVMSVDDEYSPGVFEVVTWTMDPDATVEAPSTYIHYKPVSYTKPTRNYESIIPARLSEARFFNYDDLKLTHSGGLTFAYYGASENVRFKNVQSVNLSIGHKGDGFYKEFNYTTFSAIYGFGTPAFDVMSPDVIAAISAGVGIPALLIIVAVVFVVTRMIRKRNQPKEELIIN